LETKDVLSERSMELPLLPLSQDWERGPGGESGRWPLVRCATCGLLRLHPQPTPAQLVAAYSASYAPYVRPGFSGRAKSWLERRSVSALWDDLAPPRRVLDVGCASGELLETIRQAGNTNVSGVEPDADAAQRARERGIDVHTGTIEGAALPDASIDTAILSHTLEHVPDPLETLREVQRVLRPGGALILWLPNADSIEARLLRGYWIGYDAPRHLTTFSVATLTFALHQAGFMVTSVTHEAVGLEWAWALRLWLRERWPSSERILKPLHPLLIVAGTPLALVGKLTSRSGRIRVIARKPS
jgi:SAM-dependent methyltransferase